MLYITDYTDIRYIYEIRINNIFHRLNPRVNKQICSQCRQRRDIYFYYSNVSSLLDKHFLNSLLFNIICKMYVCNLFLILVLVPLLTR